LQLHAAADHPPIHHGGTRIQPPRRPHLPPAHTPPPQARAEQEDEDEERLGWFVRQLQLDIVSPWFFLDVQALLMTIPTAKQVLWH
jgi:hypothetical protein